MAVVVAVATARQLRSPEPEREPECEERTAVLASPLPKQHGGGSLPACLPSLPRPLSLDAAVGLTRWAGMQARQATITSISCH